MIIFLAKFKWKVVDTWIAKSDMKFNLISLNLLTARNAITGVFIHFSIIASITMRVIKFCPLEVIIMLHCLFSLKSYRF